MEENEEPKIEKEITIKDIHEDIKSNTREIKMMQNFLYKMNEGTIEMNKTLKEIKRTLEKK